MNVIENDIAIHSLGDSAMVVQLGEGINPMIHHKIINIVDLLEAHPFEGFIESIPGYNNLTVHYDPFEVQQHHHQPNTLQTSFDIVSSLMRHYVKKAETRSSIKNNLVEIPVLYGGEYGPDLEYVADFNQITPDEVIELHTKKDYLVYMIGFAPGFPYLGNIDKKIAAPRKKKPSQNISAGSVGIAGEQTGIYSLHSPGGWQIIGQTPVELFKPASSPPTLLKPGDEIRFIPITKEEFIDYKEQERWV